MAVLQQLEQGYPEDQWAAVPATGSDTYHVKQLQTVGLAAWPSWSVDSGCK